MTRTLMFTGPAILSALLATAALADRLDPEVQALREAYAEISTRACAGDTSALAALDEDVRAKALPAAMAALAGVLDPQSGCAVPPDAAGALSLMGRAAEAGYPPAMEAYAIALFFGQEGFVDHETASGYLADAIDAGMATAALARAEILVSLGAELDFVAENFALARANGVGAEEYEAARSRLREALLARGIDFDPGAFEGGGAGHPGAQSEAQGGGGASAGIYQVVIGRHAGEPPRLGDTRNMGNWTDEVIFVAQGFGREGGCWTSGALYMVGSTRTDLTEYAPATLQQLLENSDRARAEGESARYVQDFRGLDEGIDYVAANPGLLDNTGQPFLWTLAEAEAYGPRCEINADPIHYPVPVRAAGY